MTIAEPSKNDLSPIFKAGVENEPMLLLDTTGSMSFPASEGSTVKRLDVVGEALGQIVTALAAKDSQAAHEEDGGGLMTITFAGGTAENIDDLNPGNWQAKWNAIQWGGGTQIMPGWDLLVDTYMEEFGEQPKEERPHLLALIITDGEASDADEFAKTLAAAKGGTYVCVAIVGFGAEHDATFKSYSAIAEQNSHVRVVSFDAVTNPSTISDAILSLLG